ncbi:MAG: hypothetical protein LBN39_02980 [Planctomycetaceae bacterium]|jgi:hypothetical protein|nr:hypothetical protein [Planctomycetaceae bacterium]
MKTSLFVHCSLFLLLVLTGCGDNIPLGGTVTFSDDGSPLEVGTIAFASGQMQARGDIGTGGKYDLGTLKVGDGLPPGDYKVYITGAEATEKGKTVGQGEHQSTLNKVTQLIDPKYTSVDKTPLTAKVDASTKQIDFKVDRAKGKDAAPQER